MLIRNTQCQESHSVMAPPRNTPAEPPAAAEAPQKPKALLSSLGSVNFDNTNVSAAGAISADPKPCKALPVLRAPSDQATPAKSDAAERTAKPHIKTFRAPNRSEKRPPSSKKPPSEIT